MVAVVQTHPSVDIVALLKPDGLLSKELWELYQPAQTPKYSMSACWGSGRTPGKEQNQTLLALSFDRFVFLLPYT